MAVMLFAACAALLATTAPAQAQASFVENFDNVGSNNSGQDGPQNLINKGWVFRNQSSPRGTTSWHDGYLPQANSIYPSPQAGAGYVAVESTSADRFGGRVSNWAILPKLSGQRAGDVLSFYAINSFSHNTPTLQVRYSPNGGTNTGSGADAVGDFTELLLDINPLPVGGWNLYRVTLPGSGRIALRYYINQACNFGCSTAYTGVDTMSVGTPPAPACNLPPVPSAGQSVVWRASASPYRVCENISIAPGATVTVEPGVRVDFDYNRQLVVNGTLNIQGTAGGRVSFNGQAVFPPIVDVINGTVNAAFADFGGQFLVESGASVALSDCAFAGYGMLRSQNLPAVTPYVRLERCRFTSSNLTMSDSMVVLRDNTFTDSYVLLLRGYADVSAPNTFVGQPLRVIREDTTQPFYLNGVNASGVPDTGGLTLSGGNFLIGPTNVLQNNLFPLEVEGGLLPGSAVPTAGNVNNAIDVNNGGFPGDGRWANFGIPYRLTELAGTLPGGRLTIDPGVTIEGDPNTSLLFRSTRRLIADGLPGAPITFRSTVQGQTWGGLKFVTNGTEGPRLEYCEVRNADYGVVSTDNLLYVENCTFQNNLVGASTGAYGTILFGKTRFLGNTTGAVPGNLGLMNLANPNAFEGNVVAIDAPLGASADARRVWWGHPSGPRAPQNPNGQGDPITGQGATGVSISPFLTASPDFNNTPPVVRLVEPGYSWSGHSPSPGYLLDPGTKYVIRWEARDTDAIVRQRILFSPDGHYTDRFVVVADNLPPGQRSFEWTVPTPGFAVTNQPQFLRVVAVDAAGQEGWDQTPLLVPSGRLQGELTITTDLTGKTFYAGQPIPNLNWTGTVSDFPTIEPFIVLESDGAEIGGVNVGGQGIFYGTFPAISTDTARLALRARNNSNDVKWFFAPGYFSIRHDPRLNLVPPTVQLATPEPGASFGGGAVVPVTWTASDDEGLYSFDIQASYDGGRTWHLVVRDLPAAARSYDWQLPPGGGIQNVRVRVIARDIRFQNNSSGTDRAFNVGQPAVALSSLTLNPSNVTGGASSQGTVWLNGAAPAGGVVVALSSSNTSAATVPASVTVPAGAGSATFTVTSKSVVASTSANISASYGGATQTATLAVMAASPALSSLTLNPTSVVGGNTSQATVTLSAVAPAGGAVVTLSSGNTAVATVPASVTVAAGATGASLTVTTKSVATNSFATISAAYGGVTRTATLTVTPAAATDAVGVTRAEYTASKRDLRVDATSNGSGAALRVYVTATNALIGTLTSKGGGKYSGQFSWPTNPQSVTVRSSLGGSATRAVTLR